MNARNPEFGGRVLSLTADELGVVESYSIQKCNQGSDNGEIQVTFDLVAITNGEGDLSRRIVPSKRSLNVVYKLISRQGHWYVLDPPKPMVSRVKLTEALRDAATSMATVVQNPMASQAQKKQHVKYKQELEILQTLK
ncbi:hypothetical protein [Geomonas propionica]|uniref:Uncharacterized protein n=1 Tax=Geomonas propionica TaxID=2798582 RepID=A0ABS0YY57_9BACT|nr:hypothetical protein [Geomonas propionica]MBJ6802682.1 hypothetical protein [Geomonas propionica]